MSIFILRLLVFAGLVLPLGSEVFAQEIRPRYRFEDGEVQRYRLIEEQKTQSSLAPEQAQRMERVYRFAVRNVDEAAGTADLEVQTESIRISSGGPVGESYDSGAGSGNTDNTTTRINDAMLQETLRITLSTRGEIVAFRGVDVEALLERAFGEAATSELFQLHLEDVRQSLGDENMKAIFQRVFVQFPDTSLEPEDTWQHQVTVNIPGFGPMHMKTRYEYVAVERKGERRLAQVRVDRDYERVETGPVGSGGVQLIFEGLESSGSGLVSFDLEAGRIQRFTFERKESGTVRPVEKQLGAPESMQVQSTSTTTLEYLGSDR